MKHTYLMSAALLSTLVGLTGCGKQAFKVTDSSVTAIAPGHYSIPPKVDILLAEDDTGSMFSLYDSISQQTPAFLQSLENSGWDYHFAVAPLTQPRTMSQVAVSKYNSNVGSSYVAPYPGAPQDPVNSLFRSIFNYSGFLTYGQFNNSLNGWEPGFQTIRDALYNKAAATQLKDVNNNPIANTGFHRQDALMVILMFGNGEDTSGVNYCPRPVDGIMVPCSDGSATSSYNYYKSQFQALRPSASQVKMYSVVSQNTTTNCNGQNAHRGDRYIRMAQDLGGAAYDVCSNSINSALAGVSSQLQAQKLSFRTKYLILNQEPNVSTIVVSKNGATVPQDATNGWTYVGGPQTVYTIDAPVQMNQATGYVIELHGSAKLIGDDTASIDFKPAGASDSH